MAYEKLEINDRVKDEKGNILVEGTKLKTEHIRHIEDGIQTVEKSVNDLVKLPAVTATDSGKLLQVTDSGSWAAVAITDGNAVAY